MEWWNWVGEGMERGMGIAQEISCGKLETSPSPVASSRGISIRESTLACTWHWQTQVLEFVSSKLWKLKTVVWE